MGNFDRDNRGGGGRSFGGKRSFGGGDRGGFRGGRDGGGRSEMHQATCSECGNACEVPFRPTGARPIFCSNCFAKQKGESTGAPRERSFDRPRFENKRPNDFRREPSNTDKTVEQLKQQLEIMNNKLERILKAVAPAISSEAKPEKYEKMAPVKMKMESKEMDVKEVKTEAKAKVKKAKAKKKK